MNNKLEYRLVRCDNGIFTDPFGNFIMHEIGVNTPAVNDAGRAFSFSPDRSLDFLISGIVALALQVISGFFFDRSFFRDFGDGIHGINKFGQH
ncbi:hypothetical protein [Flavilitoribacter nigricans]|uniref:hypothetical protein n=1 Tax=Flavilitoribacter nigricans TaxID=70997 RepID=UPI00117AB35A|nr:hypothetical protein [Flavilitoribacter nigricans]